MKKKGFTLLEVMISLALMGGLSIFIAQSVRGALKSKKKVETFIDSEALIGSIFQIMENDINLAFHYHDLNHELEKALEKELKTEGDSPYKANLKPKKLTQFVGESEEVHFTSLSNVPTVENTKESRQHEVSYFLKTCKSRSKTKKESKCLWRRSSPFIDDRIEEGGFSTVLAEDVKEFELKFLDSEEEWREEWDSSGKKTNLSLNKFPLAVEIKIGFLSPEKLDKKTKKLTKKERILSQTIKIPIFFPNNNEIIK